MYIEPSVVKQITGGIMGVFAALGFVMAFYKHIICQNTNDNTSEFFGTWFNYVATGVLVALVTGVGVYELNHLSK